MPKSSPVGRLSASQPQAVHLLQQLLGLSERGRHGGVAILDGAQLAHAPPQLVPAVLKVHLQHSRFGGVRVLLDGLQRAAHRGGRFLQHHHVPSCGGRGRRGGGWRGDRRRGVGVAVVILGLPLVGKGVFRGPSCLEPRERVLQLRGDGLHDLRGQLRRKLRQDARLQLLALGDHLRQRSLHVLGNQFLLLVHRPRVIHHEVDPLFQFRLQLWPANNRQAARSELAPCADVFSSSSSGGGDWIGSSRVAGRGTNSFSKASDAVVRAPRPARGPMANRLKGSFIHLSSLAPRGSEPAAPNPSASGGGMAVGLELKSGVGGGGVDPAARVTKRLERRGQGARPARGRAGSLAMGATRARAAIAVHGLIRETSR
mmetsp:Transcript_26674/g.67194  ORF Transcript_26674/g.67194 Transcript_26674/m.67194 type:complete len:371 (+) Transcript_26674:93-1205(+)